MIRNVDIHLKLIADLIESWYSQQKQRMVWRFQSRNPKHEQCIRVFQPDN